MKAMSKFCVAIAVLLVMNANGQNIPKWKAADLDTAITNAKGPTIINFWASFCKPCMEELPYFQQLVKEHQSAGLRLVLVNLDLRETYPKLDGFARKLKITAPIKFLDETNADLFCPVVDSSWSGAIPASLFINNKKGYRKFFEDQLSEKALEKEIKALIE
jgi:thiol-disulfide isomerase/thioredoxin